jgi:uncharacterized protein YukE
MGEKKDHLQRLSELSEKVMALGNSIQRAERDMQSTWMDEIEARDLQNVKERMKAVEDALRMLKEEVDHIEEKHARQG